MNLEKGHPRLQPGEEDFPYDLQSVLASSYHMDCRKPIDRFLRYAHLLQNRIAWTPLEFDRKTVLEIGCGPLLGWGPVAVYLGATDYVCVEPRFCPEVLDSPEIEAGYFYPSYRFR